MLAAVLYNFNNPLQIERVPKPVINDEEALIEIKACGICHTDLNNMDGLKPNLKLPRILGHEVSGVISKIGKDCKGFDRGDRVIVYISNPCTECKYCLEGTENLCLNSKAVGSRINGGFAEYLKVPAYSLVKLPKEITFEEGGLLACGVITPYHALKDIAHFQKKETVAIYGVGGLGISAVQLAKYLGARSIIAVDLVEEKLRLAKEFGADFIINASKEDPPMRIKEITSGEGVNVAIQLTPEAKVVEQGIASVRKGGKILAVGCGSTPSFQIDNGYLLRTEAKVMGCMGGTKQNLSELVNLLQSKKIEIKHIIS